MSFSLPISRPIGRQQELTNQCPCWRAIIRMLTWELISHSNTRCNAMFDSFMIRPVRTNDARHDYSVFLARLSLAISGTCPKIKHHWPKFEATRRNNECGISANEEIAILAINEIIVRITTSGSITNVATIFAFVPTKWDLARMLI